MKILYIECNMGAAGDMLMAALSELIDDREAFIKKMNNLGLPNVKVKKYISQTCGIQGTSIDVRIDGEAEGVHSRRHHHHHHTKLDNITQIIANLPVSPWVKAKVGEVYKLIADAESKAHGVPVSEIHFHEVGQLDAVADITGVCMLMEEIGADKIIASPICTGKGTVQTAHGILPVPAPATAHLLEGIPCFSGDTESELCTPTGAALLRAFSDTFSDMPEMTIQKCGIGIGKKNFDKANCVRIFLGDNLEKDRKITEQSSTVELKANIDDMTPEMLSYAMDVLIDNGALDVYTMPIYMKKNRQAVMLSCICAAADAEKFAALILKHTTTRGVRSVVLTRYTLDSVTEEIETKYGNVRVKHSSGFGVEKSKPEFEDIRRIADKTGIPAYIIAKELSL